MTMRSGPTIKPFLARRDFLIGTGALALMGAGDIRSALAEERVSDEALALIEAYNASARQLIAELGTSGNIALSPYSIGAAMSMVLMGARGATESELRKALAQTLSASKIAAASGEAMATMLAYDRSSDPHLSVANALMLGKEFGADISADYRTLLKESFSAEIFSDVSLDDVNKWVSRKTDGKIEKILDDLGGDVAAILLNAIYLRATWSVQFQKSLTADLVFYVSSKSQIKAQTMARESRDPVISGPGFRAIRLPLSDQRLGVIVVLPNAVDGLLAVDRRLDNSLRADLFRSFKEKRSTSDALSFEPSGVRPLQLPKFKVIFSANLVPPFRKLGVELAFGDGADFSGMTAGRVRLKIDQIVHRAVVEVAEDGIEAAAATVVVTVGRSAGIRPLEPAAEPFIVDRPFMFFLDDRTTGAALFEGKIIDPTKTA